MNMVGPLNERITNYSRPQEKKRGNNIGNIKGFFKNIG
ncbi:hypothetical Protein pso3_03480 [Candidatus Phytoplasma solani]